MTLQDLEQQILCELNKMSYDVEDEDFNPRGEPAISFSDAKNVLEDALLRQRQEIGRMCEGMKNKAPICYCKTHPEHECGHTSNATLSDLQSLLDNPLKQ